MDKPLGRRGGRRRRGRTGPPVLAALDLGTNNCRLLIATAGRDGGLRVVDSFSRIVRLGEGVAKTGALSEAAMERTIEALKICAELIRKSGARHVRAVATEACRRAANAEVLVARAREEAGIALSIVSAAEEARLAAIGCAPLIGAGYEGALVFDIGGGSTEAIWMQQGRVVHFVSVPLGVMSLQESSGGDFGEMRAEMRARFADVRAEMDALAPFDLARHHLLGTSGTVTTLAGVAMELPRYSRTRVDGSWHECTDILAVAQRLAGLDHAARAAEGCIGLERADLIVAGCAIFTAIHETWPCARLRVADRGLREGILRELLAGARR